MNKAIAVVVAIIVVGAAAYFLMGGTQVQAPGGSSQAYAWTFEDSTTDEASPKTTVKLSAGGAISTIGTFSGSCAEQDTDLLPNEKSKVVCWWAGGGEEIGIFTENGKDVVNVGQIDEGTAEEGGFRGDFETVLEL